MDAMKDSIGGSVLASEIFPAFNDSDIVTVDFKASVSTSKPRDCPDKELETDGLSPSDVSSSV